MVHKSLWILILLYLTITTNLCAAEWDYFGATPPGDKAELFAPGFASTQHHDDMYPVFSPDGRDAIFRINGNLDGQSHSVLYLTRRDETGSWSMPRPLPFLTHHRGGGVNFSPDGSRIYFTTKRPLPGADPAGSKSSLWFARRTEQDWSEAFPVEGPINEFNLNGGLSIAADGTMNAALAIPGRESRDVFVLECVNGKYPEYQLLPGEANTAEHEVAPYVSSAEGYMLVSVITAEGLRVRLSVRGNDGLWSKCETVAELTGPEAKFVCVSPDGKFLMFVSHKRSVFSNPTASWSITEFDTDPMEGAADIYWVRADFLEVRAAAMKAEYGEVCP